MTFFHISDLHIGKYVNGFSMIEEQEHAFDQIINYIKIYSPAVVIIAGDVYDRAVPSAEAVRVFDLFLTRLADTNTAVMLIAGNHDCDIRIDYLSRLLSDKRLFLCGVYDGNIKKITLTDEHGGVNFYLLPFIKPITYRAFTDKEPDSYEDAVSCALKTGGMDYNERNVLVSHQFYTKNGYSPIRSDAEISPIGGLDAIDAGLIEGFDYAALGHLHTPQKTGAEHIRYCGSPVKYSFSEWRQEKSVSCVELGDKGAVSVKILPLVPVHDMREIKGRLNELVNNPEEHGREDYLRVILTDEEELIDPMGKLRSVYPNIMSLVFQNTRTLINLDDIAAESIDADDISPLELFSAFFLETQGAAMSAAQYSIVRELLEAGGEL